jgi:hypothetical protein
MSVPQWRAHAARAILAYVRAVGGAAVWPEIETALATTDWYSRRVAGAPQARWIDPHHLTHGRRALLDLGALLPERRTLNNIEVEAYLDAEGMTARHQTAIARLAARKRRQYRTYLSWTGDPRLCGQVLERQVNATLDSLRGFDVMLERAAPGNVTSVAGDPVPGGPLDHAGYLVLDPTHPARGMTGFVVEDKNVRSILYPSAQEVWDLLAKAGQFPAHVPLLITQRVHFTLLTFFLAIGAVSYASSYQWFSPSIDGRQFNRIASGLGLRNARRLLRPDEPSEAIGRFFKTTLRGPNSADAGKPMIDAYQERWQRAAPVCARFDELRTELPPHQRTSLYQQVLEELDEEGIEVSDLRARHRVEDEPDIDEIDFDIGLELEDEEDG